ncbi:bromodomain-containing protein 4-like [Mustelus asterias]
MRQPAWNAVPLVQSLSGSKVPPSQQTHSQPIVFSNHQRKMQNSEPWQFGPLKEPARIIISPPGLPAVVSPLHSPPLSKLKFLSAIHEPKSSYNVEEECNSIPIRQTKSPLETCSDPMPVTLQQNVEVARTDEMKASRDNKPAPEAKTTPGPKKEIEVKNANSWASLGKMMTVTPVIKCSTESFKLFRKAAIEKEQREKAQEEMKRCHLEQADSDQKKMASEQQREKEKESVLEEDQRAQAEVGEKQTEQKMQEAHEAPEKERELARKKEQERRRREAMATTIDMNLQSDIMATFEKNLY